MATSIELSELEARHIIESTRELLLTLDDLKGYCPDIVMDAHIEDLNETLRILGEPNE